METQSPQPSFDGAATVEQAAAQLGLLRQQRREQSRPDATKQEPAKAAPTQDKPAAPDAADTDPGDEQPEQQPKASENEADADAAKEAAPKAEDDKGEKAKELAEEIAIELDGEKLTPAQLREWKKERMLHADYSRKTREHAEARKQFESEATQKAQAIQAQLEQVGFLSQLMLQQLTQEEGANLEQLKASDPARYAAAVASMHERRALLTRAYAAHQQTEAARKQQTDAQKQKAMQEQASRLPELIPDWADERTAAAEKAQLAEYLGRDGLFNADELANVSDARFVALARKAMKFDAAEKQRKEIVAKKIEKPVPKLQKGGVASADAVSHELTKAEDRARKSGDYRDWAAALRLKQQRNK